MGKEIDRLDIAVEAQTKEANTQIENLIKKLELLSPTLSRISTGGLANLASGVSKLSNGVKNVKSTDFNRLVENIKKIDKVDTASLYKTANALRNITNTFNGMSSLSNSALQIGEFGKNISKLNSKSINSAITNLPLLAKELRNIDNTLSGMGTLSDNTIQIGNFAQSISKLGYKSVQSAITNLPLLAKELRAFMTSMSTMPRVSENTIKMTNALSKLASQGAKIKTATNGLNSIFGKTSQSAKSAAGAVKFFGNATKRAHSSTNSLTTTIGKLFIAYQTIKKTVEFIGKSIKKSMDFGETINLFQTSFKKIGTDSAAKNGIKLGTATAENYATAFIDRAQAFNNKITSALSLDPDTMMNFQAVFASMTNSMGLNSQSVENLSSAFTMLGTDIASLFNTDISVAMEKLKSGLSGQIKPLRDIGVDISQASLQMTAYRYGIKDSVVKMSQAAKVQLRYLTIMEQTKVAWGDMAKTIDSPANQLRILQQQWSNLSRSIGNVFMPIVTKVLPYINALVIAFRKMTDALANLLGFKLPDYKNTAITGSSDAMNDMSDSADGAAKANEKLKKTMLGIDEINQLSKPQSTTEKHASGSGYAELDTAITTETAAYMKKFQEELDKMNNNAEQMSNKIVEFFTKIKDASIPTMEAIKRFNTSLEPFKTFVAQGITDFYNNLLKPLGVWMLGEGLPRFFDISSKLVSEIDWGILNLSMADFWTTLTNLGTFIFTGLFDFYEYFLKPVAAWAIGEGLPRLLDTMTNLVDNVNWEKLRDSLINLWDSLSPFAVNVGEGLLWFIENVLTPLATWVISDAIPVFLDLLAAGLDVLNPLIDALKPLGVWLFDNFLKPIAIWTGGVIVETINSLSGALERFGSWVSGNKETIKTFTEIMLGFFGIWKTAEFISLLGQMMGGNGFAGLTKAIWINVSAWGAATLAKAKDFIGTLAINALYIGDFFKAIGTATKALWTNAAAWFAANWQIVLIIAGIGFLVGGIVALVANWDKMSGAEKAATILGSIAAAATAAAVAMGIFHASWTIGVGAAAIAGGIALLVGVYSSTKDYKVPTASPGQVNMPQMPRFNMPAYANGGFVTADIFAANENGNPEIVGKIGNRTAVANTNQITDAIKGAVVEGMIQVMPSFTIGNNQVIVENSFYAGDDVLYKSVQRAQRKEDRRYNVVSQIV